MRPWRRRREIFAALYSGLGRPRVAPEMLLRTMLLRAFYSVRSERQLMERLEFDLLFRWFVGLGIGDSECGIGASPVKRPLSSEHF
jgi:transposase